MERTNIAEILKNAPQGLELWSDAHGVVKLEKVDTNCCYPIFVKCGNGTTDNFRDNGALFYDESFYPCILWPSKDHRSWSGWQDILLKAWDVVVNKNNNKVEIMRDVQTMWADNGTIHTFSSLCSYRYATPEERERFFKELEANGYRWDANKKEVAKIEEEKEPMTREKVVKSREYIFADEACKYVDKDHIIQAFEEGAEFGYQFAVENGDVWHDAESDDLPPYDKEVIVLLNKYEPFYNVCFAHRPDPAGWDGKDLDTGEIKHYQAKTYGKGGWNIFGVKWWLDVELPKVEEEEQ